MPVFPAAIFIAGLFWVLTLVMPGAAPRFYDWRDAWTLCVWLLTLFRLRFRCVTVHTAFHPGRVAEVLNAAGERVGLLVSCTEASAGAEPA